jgi:hypothetical protein
MHALNICTPRISAVLHYQQSLCDNIDRFGIAICTRFTTTADTMATNLAFPVNNYQSQSPLFGLLPGEIRNEIFALALLQYESDAAAYPKDSYWYRPGFAGPRRSCSGLLRTCKLAYAEGRQVFLDQLEWAFWFGNSTPSIRHTGRS